MDRDFVRDNDASRRELRDLIVRLDDAGLARDAGNGWTVATVLCHLAFWDRVVLRRLTDWQRDGVEPQMLNQATNSVNEAVRDLSRAVPVREAGRMAAEAAETLDAFIAGLDDAFIATVNAAGFGRSLRRSLHRRGHLARIA